MKRWLIIALTLTTQLLVARETLISIIATVNNNPITLYDVQRYNQFIFENSGGQITNSIQDGLQSWFTLYILRSLAEKDKRYQLAPGEIQDALLPYVKMTNENPQLASLFTRYRDLLEMRVEVNLYIQKLTFFDEEFKRSMYQGIDEQKAKAFYETNKTNFLAPPRVSLMVFAAPYPKNASLTELENLEKSFNAIAKEAAKTTNAPAIIEKYKKSISFTPYSGTSPLTNAQDLFVGGYPEEILGLAIEPTYYKQYLDKGKVFGPQVIQFRKDKKKYLLVMRVLAREESRILSYEEVKNYIYTILQNQQVEKAIDEWCASQIKNRKVIVEIKDKNYQGALDAYLRR
ncbi:peptidylprolyl isomerase [Thermospira aquatica]|uniref:Peptidyl-prolyl cis-trans isomerase n=1 Tax=Thermospira aquatica TaxID=2828656 RepID=A0AAX3BDU4_9SPIR|nr:peptidylprolyl isomerase [Thermospira aquatica]URA10513.1 peptidyl-prolyl cis-trans isomerase [Thermospira aquatica]